MVQFSNLIAKTVGLTGLGLVLFDAHTAGKITAPLNEKNLKAEQLKDQFMNNRKLDSTSTVRNEANKVVFKYFTDEHLTGFFTNIAGYLKGAVATLVNDVVPLGLAVGTVMTKGVFSKAFGVGLLGYGGIFLLQKAFGIGKPKE